MENEANNISKISDLIKEMSVESLKVVEDLVQVQSNRLYPISEDDLYNIVEYNLAHNREIEEVFVERTNLIGAMTKIEEYKEKILEYLKSVDKGYLSEDRIKIDLITKKDKTQMDFRLFFVQARPSEFVSFLSRPEAMFTSDDDKPSFYASVTSYCNAKKSSIFDFCEMAIEIADYKHDNDNPTVEELVLEKRAKEHNRLLYIDVMRGILEKKSYLEDLFKKEVFFDYDIGVRVKVGPITEYYSINIAMDITETTEEDANDTSSNAIYTRDNLDNILQSLKDEQSASFESNIDKKEEVKQIE